MFYKKTLILSLMCSNCSSKDEKIFKEGYTDKTKK